MSQSAESKPAMGCGELIRTMMLYGGGMSAVIGLLSCASIAFDWDLELGIYGTSTALPEDWVAALFLLGLGIVLMAGGWLIGFVGRRRVSQ